MVLNVLVVVDRVMGNDVFYIDTDTPSQFHSWVAWVDPPEHPVGWLEVHAEAGRLRWGRAE